MTHGRGDRRSMLAAIDHGRAGLSGQLRSEWTKLRSVRSTWVCLVIVVVAGIGLSALVTDVEAGRWGTLGLADRATFDPVRFSQTGTFLSQFVVGVLGALVVTSEYATGSIRTTLSASSRRGRRCSRPSSSSSEWSCWSWPR